MPGWSLFTILTPFGAWAGLGVLLLVRVAMGTGEAVTFASFYSLLSRWNRLAERSRAVGFAVAAGVALFGLAFCLVLARATGQFD